MTQLPRRRGDGDKRWQSLLAIRATRCPACGFELGLRRFLCSSTPNIQIPSSL